MTALTFLDGKWQEGNPLIFGATTHAAWLSSVVFDGARAFGRLVPDLDRHCQRTIDSADSFGLIPTKTAAEILEIALDGVRRFPPDAELYIRPMFWAEGGFVVPDPETTRFCLTLVEAPLNSGSGFSAYLSRYRRPLPETAPTDAKASCLYPNVWRAMRQANADGYDNAVTLDPLGNVAEFLTSNLFVAKDGVAHTPIANGTFLSGITRRRVIALLRDAGTEVVERTITYDEVKDADEIFSTGNYQKVMAVTRIEDRNLQPGPVYQNAHRLYFEFAREQPVP